MPSTKYQLPIVDVTQLTHGILPTNGIQMIQSSDSGINESAFIIVDQLYCGIYLINSFYFILFLLVDNPVTVATWPFSCVKRLNPLRSH